MARRSAVLYLQYTNPAAYPPLEHSSRILAGLGWDVFFLGTDVEGVGALSFPAHPKVRIEKLPYCPPGWRQKLHYALFCLRAFFEALRMRPSWIYVSDTVACPAGLLAGSIPGVRMIYHEHDSPGSGLSGFVGWARRRLAEKSALCILPNEKRAEAFRNEIGSAKRVFVVWNCPSVGEAQGAARPAPENGGVRLLYHGSIVPQRVPLSLVEALKILPEAVTLTVIGYETAGHSGYGRELLERAASLGLGGRVTVREPMPRFDLMRHSVQFDAGLSLISSPAGDSNLNRMPGASNKTFDYAACGLAVLVPDEPEWRRMFVEPGFGLACDPDDPKSIAAAVRTFAERPAVMREMGEKGRRQVLSDWNYEKQFGPVLSFMEKS